MPQLTFSMFAVSPEQPIYLFFPSLILLSSSFLIPSSPLSGQTFPSRSSFPQNLWIGSVLPNLTNDLLWSLLTPLKYFLFAVQLLGKIICTHCFYFLDLKLQPLPSSCCPPAPRLLHYDCPSSGLHIRPPDAPATKFTKLSLASQHALDFHHSPLNIRLHSFLQVSFPLTKCGLSEKCVIASTWHAVGSTEYMDSIDFKQINLTCSKYTSSLKPTTDQLNCH